MVAAAASVMEGRGELVPPLLLSHFQPSLLLPPTEGQKKSEEGGSLSLGGTTSALC